MIAGAEDGKQGAGNRGQTGRDDHRLVAALERRKGLGQGAVGLRAVPAIGDGLELVLVALAQVLDRLEQDRRGAVDRRVNHSLIVVRMVARVGGDRAVFFALFGHVLRSGFDEEMLVAPGWNV